MAQIIQGSTALPFITKSAWNGFFTSFNMGNLVPLICADKICFKNRPLMQRKLLTTSFIPLNLLLMLCSSGVSMALLLQLCWSVCRWTLIKVRETLRKRANTQFLESALHVTMTHIQPASAVPQSRNTFHPSIQKIH